MITTVTDDISFKYDFSRSEDILDMSHKLFCTFTSLQDLDDTLFHIKSSYAIIYNKIFVLEAKEQNEFLITYNVDPNNLKEFPENTILVHRKKESNTLYTINALNELIKELNGGVLDKRYQVDWRQYRNTILLTKGNDLKKLKTTLHKIIETKVAS